MDPALYDQRDIQQRYTIYFRALKLCQKSYIVVGRRNAAISVADIVTYKTRRIFIERTIDSNIGSLHFQSAKRVTNKIYTKNWEIRNKRESLINELHPLLNCIPRASSSFALIFVNASISTQPESLRCLSSEKARKLTRSINR